METKEKTKPSIYEIITMTPNIAYDRVIEELNDESPDFELIKDIFENSLIGVNYVDKPERISNKSALHHAAWNGKDKVVEFLLEIGADPNIKSRSTFGYTPLHCSAEQGHSKVIELLLKAGADVHAQDDDPDTDEGGFTPLYIAIRGGYTQIVKLLLEAGSNPNAKTNNGITPLHIATMSEEPEIFSILLNSGANPNAIDEIEYSVLHWLFEMQIVNFDFTFLILESGVNTDLKNYEGKTALDMCLKLNEFCGKHYREKKEESDKCLRLLKLFQNYKNKQIDPA